MAGLGCGQHCGCRILGQRVGADGRRHAGRRRLVGLGGVRRHRGGRMAAELEGEFLDPRAVLARRFHHFAFSVRRQPQRLRVSTGERRPQRRQPQPRPGPGRRRGRRRGDAFVEVADARALAVRPRAFGALASELRAAIGQRRQRRPGRPSGFAASPRMRGCGTGKRRSHGDAVRLGHVAAAGLDPRHGGLLAVRWRRQSRAR
mmetsp:Transcript_73918/g.214119  ORF Transcript_73918/g.214119 Transcript_73918/m.214119 type:complete len:203 (+) Transcript_73918:314-922(+)